MTAFTPGIQSPTTGPAGSPPIVFFDDFVEGRSFTTNTATVASAQGKFSELANMGDWLVTVVDGGADNGETITIADNTDGGHVVLVTNDANNDALNCQQNGEAFSLDGDKTLVFEVRFHATDVSEVDWFFGLAITDTDILGGVTDRIGFECPDSTADIDAVTERNSTQTSTDTGSNVADATFVTLRFEATTSKAKFYVDGALKASHTTNLPDDEQMTPSFHIRADGAAAQTVTVDYIMVTRER